MKKTLLLASVAVASLTSAVSAADLKVCVSWSNFREERWKTDEAAIKGALDAAAKARAAALTSTEAAAVEGEQEDDHFGFGCCGGYVDGVTNERMHRAECRS